MNAQRSLREMEIAAWEMAEATSRENAARDLRRNAARRIAAVHAHFKDAFDQCKQSRDASGKPETIAQDA